MMQAAEIVDSVLASAQQAVNACGGETIMLAFVMGVLIGWPIPRARWMRNGQGQQKPPSSSAG